MKLVNKKLKNQKGMAATEYIIGLILVAVASIGIFAVFGNQIKIKVSQVTAALNGASSQEDYTKAQSNSKATTEQGVTISKTENNMNGAASADMNITSGTN